MGRPKGSKNKPKVMVANTVVAEAEQFLNDLPVKEEGSGFNFTPDIDERVSENNTRPTPTGQYSQYIHPCNLEGKEMKWRFLSIIRDGINYSSVPFDKREDCEALLKRLIENPEAPISNKLITN